LSDMSGQKLIEIAGVSKVFDDKKVVNGVNLTINKGDFVTLLGPSGCGKTTLLRMIAGFDVPTEGQILLRGEDLVVVPPYLRNINTVFQRYALFPHLNVYNNIAFGLRLKRIEKTVTDAKGNQKTVKIKLTREEIERKVTAALKIVGLTDYEYRDVNSLSGGQQQRVAIARAIVNEPEVLLLDEPLGALDLKMRKDMQLELKEMHHKLGISFIYVTHDQEEALTMSDVVVVMKDGIVQQVGSPFDVYNDPVNAFVADFIGESNIIDGVISGPGKVSFGGREFSYDTDGFETGEDIEVVIRPEDIYMLSHDKTGIFSGEVVSSVFKGVHYEMAVKTDSGLEFTVQETAQREAGAKVSLVIKDEDIHVMKLMRRRNTIDGVMKSASAVEMYGEVFPCDGSQLVPGSTLDENGTLRGADGEEIDLSGREVICEIEFEDIDLTDYETDGVLSADVISILYKGDHYHVEVKTDDGDFFYVDDMDKWDDGDRVGVRIIEPGKIKLSFKAAEEEA